MLLIFSALVGIHIYFIYAVYGQSPSIMNALQAKSYYRYKNTKLKLLKTNAAIWYNKMCITKQIKPNYINIKINGRSQQDKKTISNAIKFRTKQEIKFLYRKKQHLNQQLYHTHLQCAQYYADTPQQD